MRRSDRTASSTMRRFDVLLLVLSLRAGAAFSCFSPARANAALPHRGTMAIIMADEDTKGAVGGAVLGGLLAGPFGALWGAQIGGAMGANNRAKREQSEALESLGLSKDMMALAQQTAAELQEAEASLAIVRSAESSQRNLVSTFDRAMEEAYTAAAAKLRSGDEAAARQLLEQRQAAKAKKAVAEAELADAAQRVAAMQANVAALAQRASEIEQRISRRVVSSRPSGAEPMFDAPPMDPLEKRFRDLEK